MLVAPLLLDRTETGDAHISAKMIRSFSERYDPQPMHLDDEAARKTVFGELVGSGWQTLAITMWLLVDARLLKGGPIVGVEFQNTRFHRPMRPGDTLRASVEVLGLRRSSRADRGLLELLVITTNALREPLVTQTWTLLLPPSAPREWLRVLSTL